MNDMRAARWRKSSRSDHSGGQCVEVASLAPAVRWRKSSRSDHSGGDCVEVAGIAPVVAVRDSKDPDGPRLTFGAAAWHAFTRLAKENEYDPA